MNPLSVFLEANPWAKRVLRGLGWLAAAALALTLAYCQGRHDEAAKTALERERANAKIEVRKGQADAAATVQRSTDTAAVAAKQEGRADAYAKAPDSVPSDARRAFNCRRLYDAYPNRTIPGC